MCLASREKWIGEVWPPLETRCWAFVVFPLLTKYGAFRSQKNRPIRAYAAAQAGGVTLANVESTSQRDRPARILVVDDDDATRTLLRRLLSMEGYVIDEAPDGPSAIEHLSTVPADLLLVDVMMPGQDGLDLLAQLRRTSDVPVILLTAKADEGDRVLGLRSGADDYVVKPFFTAELAARIDAVLRRAEHRRPAASKLEFGDLEINPSSRQVTVRGSVVELPPREFELLVFMASSPGQVFSREQLLAEVWRSSGERQDPGTVTEHARRLRQHIEADADRPRWIKTVRGIGYRFEP
ncbi:MAG: hypothetical protein QOJ52_505 [Acidimicrobiaceae bacterium]|nr:hypothetical protein [Acidimicrobiaceae bacterium]